MWIKMDIKNMHYLLGLGRWEIKLLCVYLIYKDRRKEKGKSESATLAFAFLFFARLCVVVRD